uniref:BZIP domain-containing protein n=1 Tax=Kalanchoe fedtschenkoi TaxID=63787 RepID=A0A7N0TSB6_KALFE
MASLTNMMTASSTTTINSDLPRRTASSDHNTKSANESDDVPEDTTSRQASRRRTVEDVWKGIVAGEKKVCKVEVPDDMMTLEDFLVRAGAVDREEVVDDHVKVRVPLSASVSAGLGTMTSRLLSFDSINLSPFPSGGGSSIYGSGIAFTDSGGLGRRNMRGSCVFEPLDKAAQKRQRRMIKNRESAARSRERKQEHQVKLESLASKLEEENDHLMKEKAAQTKERLKLVSFKIYIE